MKRVSLTLCPDGTRVLRSQRWARPLVSLEPVQQRQVWSRLMAKKPRRLSETIIRAEVDEFLGTTSETQNEPEMTKKWRVAIKLPSGIMRDEIEAAAAAADLAVEDWIAQAVPCWLLAP